MSLEFVVGNPKVVVLACLAGVDVVCWCSSVAVLMWFRIVLVLIFECSINMNWLCGLVVGCC